MRRRSGSSLAVQVLSSRHFTLSFFKEFHLLNNRFAVASPVITLPDALYVSPTWIRGVLYPPPHPPVAHNCSSDDKFGIPMMNFSQSGSRLYHFFTVFADDSVDNLSCDLALDT